VSFFPILKIPDPSVARVFPKLYIALFPRIGEYKNVMDIKNHLTTPSVQNRYITSQKWTFSPKTA
jgi:hypothetical protein